MEKFFKRKTLSEPSSIQDNDDRNIIQSSSKQSHVEINFTERPVDPGLRIRILDYHSNDRDQVRRAYLQKGPFQPRGHNFPQKKIGEKLRRFNFAWFDEYPVWLEYSVIKDAAFCLCCYLFRPDNRELGGDSFITEGFSNWKKKETFELHIGGPNSTHMQAWKKCEDLMKQKHHVQIVILKQSNQAKREYRARLNASIDCVHFLLRQGLAFRGHNESLDSKNQENFLEILQFLADHNEDINNVVLQNAPENLKLTTPDIQKDIVNAAATETTNAIINDLGDAFFSILVDESHDISFKEQMAIAFRYVDKYGQVIECFMGIVHVSDTSACSLKKAIEAFLAKHGLSISKLRDQGYDGTSNMQDKFNGLKTLIMNDNNSAYYIHCFAHQLQLALVAVAKNHIQVALLFNQVASVMNVVGASCKRQDILREKQAVRIVEAIDKGKLSNGQGLNQETSLKRAGDTRWDSYYNSLINLIIMFSSVIDVLEIVMKDGSNSDQRAEACNLLDTIQSFEFAFSLHLMKSILGITNELSQSLQRKEQDILNAMNLVKISKQRLQIMRDHGWDSLLSEVSSFCEKHNIIILNMDDIFAVRGCLCRRTHEMTNLHHYRAELFYNVIDMQLQELNSRLTVSNTELLLCVACLNPSDSFSLFDKEKLIRLARLYPDDFSSIDIMTLDNQLETYILDMRSTSEFSEVLGIGDLAKKMVEKKKDILYPLVYSLIKLVLILPVATATVERAFSAMKIVKNRLRNRMGDQWMSDNLVTYIERDVFDTIGNEVIMNCFQTMKTRIGQL